MKREILIGLLLSFGATIAGCYLYMEFIMPEGFEKSWQWMIDKREQGSIISLGAIPNLLLFFVFNRRHELYKARGVLMGVVITALIVTGFFVARFF